MKSLLVAGSLVGLAACPGGPQTAYGPNTIVVTNHASYPLCHAALFPDRAKMRPTEELVFARTPTIAALQPGQSMRSTIRSGSWKIFAESCDSEHVLAGHESFDIAGNVAISFDGDDTASPPDYRRISLRLETTSHAPAGRGGGAPASGPASCLATDAPMQGFDAAQCCSGRSYTQHGDPFCAN